MLAAPVLPSEYGVQHQAVRVFSDPSEITLSGPMVTSGLQPGSCWPVRSPAARNASSVSTYAPTRTRSSSAPAVARAGHSSTAWSNSRSTRPTTPLAAAALMLAR